MGMDNIVSLRERIENREKKKQLERYRGKIESLRKIIQCSSCHLKCAMCGRQIETKAPGDPLKKGAACSAGMIFCRSCRDEFEDYLSISRGKQRSDIFWHNQEWKSMWSAWINYRKTIQAFMDSPEFKSLLEEINIHI